MVDRNSDGLLLFLVASGSVSSLVERWRDGRVTFAPGLLKPHSKFI